MDEQGLVYLSEDPPEEDVKRAEKEWGDRIEEQERKIREFEKEHASTEN